MNTIILTISGFIGSLTNIGFNRKNFFFFINTTIE